MALPPAVPKAPAMTPPPAAPEAPAAPPMPEAPRPPPLTKVSAAPPPPRGRLLRPKLQLSLLCLHLRLRLRSWHYLRLLQGLLPRCHLHLCPRCRLPQRPRSRLHLLLRLGYQFDHYFASTCLHPNPAADGHLQVGSTGSSSFCWDMPGNQEDQVCGTGYPTSPGNSQMGRHHDQGTNPCSIPGSPGAA